MTRPLNLVHEARRSAFGSRLSGREGRYLSLGEVRASGKRESIRQLAKARVGGSTREIPVDAGSNPARPTRGP